MNGWFADVDEEAVVCWFADVDEEAVVCSWRPYVQVSFGCFGLEIWFDTEEACLNFINDELTGLEILP